MIVTAMIALSTQLVMSNVTVVNTPIPYIPALQFWHHLRTTATFHMLPVSATLA
jgi:hypothetical protein